MNHLPPRPARLRIALSSAALLLCCSPGALARGPDARDAVHRCGNSYGSAPCPGGEVVNVDDRRSDTQRREALALKAQEARLAEQLAAERRARESAAAGQGPARIGPTAAERAQADARTDRARAKADARAKKHKKQKHPPRQPRPARPAGD